MSNFKDFIREANREVTDRDNLLTDLEAVKDIAFSKIDLRNSKNQERIRWCNVIVRCCGVADQILKNKDLDELEVRLRTIEVALKIE